ncbi:MAG: hypothetical protein ABJA02_03715 [Acidobacteriota bacterium]
MENTQKLRNARNVLLKLHKTLVDYEREMYEGIHGPMTAAQFLNVLLEDQDLAWLRKFSMLIVEIDEMFDIKDGVSGEMVNASLVKVVELAEMRGDDESFKTKYQSALQQYPEAAGSHAELKRILSEN